ncbi:hypothetical protein FCIRC_1213 [Fusarium circinatum]|uniref:Uncharacterized protein n=1 Tax=Fusarium circinatum TaxID=48490 RepID=A0A8H5XAW3_FUSCI|nr:hypothetical protein FCIRC_1213 [Fusarium circinatum]
MDTDPSEPIDESIWDSATVLGPKLYKDGTMMWKNCTALCKDVDDKDWIPMKKTGQWEIRRHWELYLTGGEIRRKK